MEDVFDVKEAAEYLHCSESTIRKLMKTKQIQIPQLINQIPQQIQLQTMKRTIILLKKIIILAIQQKQIIRQMYSIQIII